MLWELASLPDTERALASRRQWQACVYAESMRFKGKFRGRKDVEYSEEIKEPSLPPSLYSHELYLIIDRRDNVALLHHLFYSKKRGAQVEASEEARGAALEEGPTAEVPSGPQPAVRCRARFFAALAPREDPRDLFASTCSRLVKVNGDTVNGDTVNGDTVNGDTVFQMDLVSTSLERGFRVILKDSREVAATLVDLLGDTPSYYFCVQESADAKDDRLTLNFLIRLRLSTHPVVALSSPLADDDDEGEAAPSNPVCPGEPGGASPRDAASDFLAELDVLVRLLSFVRAENGEDAAIEQSEADRQIVVAVREKALRLASAWSEDSSTLFMKELDTRLARLNTV